MTEQDEYKVKLAKLLDELEPDIPMTVTRSFLEKAFGGTKALALAEAAAFGRVHGCTFHYNRTQQRGKFLRTIMRGGRA